MHALKRVRAVVSEGLGGIGGDFGEINSNPNDMRFNINAGPSNSKSACLVATSTIWGILGEINRQTLIIGRNHYREVLKNEKYRREAQKSPPISTKR